MGLVHSPNIVTNALVFYCDINNSKKSWRGRPITNQFAIPTPQSNGRVIFSVEGNGEFFRQYSGNFGGYDIKPTDVVYKFFPTAVGACWYHGNDVTINAGQTATWSFDYYVDPSIVGYVNTNYLANFEGVVSGAITDPTPSIVGVWKRLTVTSTASSTGTCRMLLYPGACGGYLASGGFVLFKNPQVEFDAPGNNPSPFVVGVRYANSNLEPAPSYPTWNQNAGSTASGGTLTFTSGSYNSKNGWDLYKTYSGLSTGTNYTWSALVKLGTANNLIITMNNTQAWNTGPSSVVSELSTTDWTRVSITGTTNTGSFNLHLGASLNMEVASTIQSGGTVFIQDVRLFLSNSETAIEDLMAQNTINATSLTYNADGTFSFNGSSDKLTLGTNTLISATQNYTIEAIFKTNAVGSANYIFGNYGVGNTGGLEYYVYQNKLNNYINGNTQSTTSLNANQWYISCVTRNESTVTHYLNGIPDGSSVNGNSISANNPFTIGNGHDYTSEAFAGTIASIKIYNRALSEVEVLQNFTALRGLYGI